MARMTRDEAESFLSSPDHKGTAILAVARPGKGPMVVPLAFRFRDGVFEFDTKPSRRHVALQRSAVSVPLVVDDDARPTGCLERLGVAAEGPIAFADPRPADDEFGVAVLTPESFVGVAYE